MGFVMNNGFEEKMLEWRKNEDKGMADLSKNMNAWQEAAKNGLEDLKGLFRWLADACVRACAIMMVLGTLLTRRTTYQL